MSVFAVTYHYVADSELVSAIRPSHREWLSGLLGSGALLASGPMVNYPGGLLIFRSASIADLNQLLDQDPMDIAGAIAERTIQEWNPIFGPFNS